MAIKILIVDDSEEDRETFERLLKQGDEAAFTFSFATNAKEAMESFVATRPDCVLLDNRLPDEDGIQLLAKLLELNDGPFLPVVMLSGQGNESVAVSALKGGAQDYVVKGTITSQGIKRVVHNAIEKTALQKKLARQTEELTEQNIKLEQSSRFKSEFLANMSHEIRTPMNGVLGLADILLESSLNPEQRNFLEMIRRSGEALLMILNDILDFSKIEAGKLSLESIAFPFPELVKDTVEMFTRTLREKGIQLQVNIEKDVPETLTGDPYRLKQVLTNLLSNAVKFTPSGIIAVSITSLSVTETKVELRVEVKDSGRGIPKDRIQLLFSEFQQLDASTTRKFGGTGLGLSICKRLVGLMGGSIGVVSEEGQGATFWFKVIFDVAKSTEVKRPKTMEISPHKNHGRCILVVEDDSINQVVITKMLGFLGFTVTVASDGNEALVAIGQKSFDLVLMDCQMPEMDGFEATAAIRSREKGGAKRVPILALTANAKKEDAEKCILSGMDDHLSKPIRLDNLAQKLEQWISK